VVLELTDPARSVGPWCAAVNKLTMLCRDSDFGFDTLDDVQELERLQTAVANATDNSKVPIRGEPEAGAHTRPHSGST